MGCGPFKVSSCSCINSSVETIENTGMDFRKYKILRLQVIGLFVIVEAQYDDCTNYEGRKILVYKDLLPADIVCCESLDPHFCPNCMVSPIARFEPTDRGWYWATVFAEQI